MTTLLGFDVLDTEPNRDGTIPFHYARSFALLDNKTGRRTTDDHAGVPGIDFPFSWFCPDRSEVAKLRAFIDARAGRAVPFWVPSYCRDMELFSDVLNNSSSFLIKSHGYARYQFPQFARRYLAVFSATGAFTISHVTNASDNGDGTESIILESPVVALPQATMISFLMLCRLDDDMPEIIWHTLNTAESMLTFREIPKEVTA